MFLLIVFIASLTSFSATGALAILCFNEMEEDLKRRSQAYIKSVVVKGTFPLTHKYPINDNHKPIQSFKT